MNPFIRQWWQIIRKCEILWSSEFWPGNDTLVGTQLHLFLETMYESEEDQAIYPPPSPSFFSSSSIAQKHHRRCRYYVRGTWLLQCINTRHNMDPLNPRCRMWNGLNAIKDLPFLSDTSDWSRRNQKVLLWFDLHCEQLPQVFSVRI